MCMRIDDIKPVFSNVCEIQGFILLREHVSNLNQIYEKSMA